MNKYTKLKYICTILAAINIITLSGCNIAQSDSASSSETSNSENINQADTADNNSTSISDVDSSGNIPTIKSFATHELDGGTAAKNGEDITSTEENKSGVKASNSGKLSIDNSKIVTQGKSISLNDSNFFGLNSGVLAESRSEINLKSCEISTSGDGATAVFAKDSNSTITLNGTKIETSASSSKALAASYRGAVFATGCTIDTKGTDSAGIAITKGGGTINVVGGTINTAGVNSPAICSAGDVSVTGAVLKAAASQGAIVDGKSTINLTAADITSSGENCIMLYRSLPDTTEFGTTCFNMVGGSLTSSLGSLFYITNTHAIVNLTNSKLTNSTDTLISSVAGKWGTEGENGGNVDFTASMQTLSGNIVCDNLSTVNFNLNNSSNYTGTINGNCAGKEVNMTLDASSVWNVTGDSYVAIFNDSLTLLTNIKDNGHTIFYDSKNKDNKWLEGKTITLSGGGKLTPDKSKGSLI